MHNFEARYGAIVEKEPKLQHDVVWPYGKKWLYWSDSDAEPAEQSLARAAVCWWLLKELKKVRRAHVLRIIDSDDLQEAVMTEWEIILGIKEKA